MSRPATAGRRRAIRTLIFPLLLACGGTEPSVASPAGSYQLHSVNGLALPALAFLNQAPYFQQNWVSGRLTIDGQGRWVETIVLETTTADVDSLETVEFSGPYVGFPDHLNLVVDSGPQGEWLPVQEAEFMGGSVNLRATSTSVFTYKRQ